MLSLPKFFRKNKIQDPVWIQYKAKNQHKLSGNTPVENLTFAVIDTETTGFDTKKDEIISVAGILVKNNEIFIETGFEYIIKSGKKDEEGVAIHGILPGQTAKGTSEKVVMQKLLDFLDNHILVAHAAKFDVTMINKALNRNLSGKILNQVLDTAELAYRLNNTTNPYPEINKDKYSLDELCKTFNIKTENRHTAYGDVFITAQLLVKLLQRVKAKKINTYRELFRSF